MNPQIAAAIAELRRRARARQSLHSYALSVDIPTVAFEAPCLDEDLFGPARFYMASHHAKILEVLERCMNTPFGRCMIFAPPGSAKSLYASVLAPTWEMGRKPSSRIILASYGGKIAERQARRAMQIIESQKYRDLWPETPTLVRDAAGDFMMSNKSEMLSLGMTGGVTGNRATGMIIDDPIAGREEADSELERQNTLDAYQDDLLTRLLPGAWLAFIMTRWNEQDLAGSILPDDYKGESGMIRCKDGLMWEVLNIPAKCEHLDDPLGRKLDEYLWPEFYPERHWQMFELAKGAEAARVWASLYQQRPTAQGDGRLDEKAIHYYQPGTEPTNLAFFGAGDYAVSSGKNDFTELGTWGVDPEGGLWEVDWWHKQCDTGVSTEETLSMVKRRKLPMWFNEGGVIDKAMSPLLNLRSRQRKIFTDRRVLTSMQDKIAKCSAFIARANSGMVHMRDNANSRRIIKQVASLPAGRYDDAADVCGLAGRAVDQFIIPRVPQKKERHIIKPFTAGWFTFQEADEQKKVRYK